MVVKVARFFIAILMVLTTALVSAAAENTDSFRLEDFFQGRTVAHGSLSAINGINRQFDVKLSGQWDGTMLKLVEDFVYYDGVEETKTWYFKKIDEGRYIGRRDDVEGLANVRVFGNTAYYSYKLYLDAENRKNLVRLVDRLTLKSDGTVENRAAVFKFGVPVGGVKVNFAKASEISKLERP